MIVLGIIIWYFSGLLGWFWFCINQTSEITIRDVITGVFLMGVFGFIPFMIIGLIFIKDCDLDRPIYKRRK